MKSAFRIACPEKKRQILSDMACPIRLFERLKEKGVHKRPRTVIMVEMVSLKEGMKERNTVRCDRIITKRRDCIVTCHNVE